MLIGLTGGIASGKSTVARMLHNRGAVIVDADVLAREVVEQGTPALRSIRSRFGDALVLADGSLDREALGRIVFDDATARAELNAIVHPAVRDLAKKRFSEAAQADPDAVIVYDVPLLAETGTSGQFDLVVLADAPAAVRQQRLIELRGASSDDAIRRIEAQANDSERRRISDVIIDTAGPIEATQEQVDALWQRISPAESN